MTTMNATNARKRFYGILQEVNNSHEPIHITSKNGGAVLLSEEDWRSIQETLFLSQIPGMTDSIKDGLNEPLSKTRKTLDW